MTKKRTRDVRRSKMSGKVRGTVRALSRAVRYAWAGPNSIIGLLFLPTVMLPGGRARVVDGVLEIHGPVVAAMLERCIPIAGGALAITFGHVVLGRDSLSLEATRRHERVHVRQCEVWGVTFMPAYLAAGLWAFVNGNGAYDGNHFERQACQAEERSHDKTRTADETHPRTLQGAGGRGN